MITACLILYCAVGLKIFIAWVSLGIRCLANKELNPVLKAPLFKSLTVRGILDSLVWPYWLVSDHRYFLDIFLGGFKEIEIRRL